MKNSLKKCFALLLAMVMVFAMATSVFAYDINIKNNNGNTYTAYKVASFETSDGLYTDLKVLAPFKTGTLAPTEVDGEVIVTSEKKLSDLLNGKPFNYQKAKDLANELAQVEGKPVVASTTEEKPNTITITEKGYYLIVETLHGNNTEIQAGNMLIAVAGNEDIEVYLKNSKPSVQKKIVLEGTTKTPEDPATGTLVDTNVVAIGDTVTYDLKATIPSYPENVSNVLFMLTDKMSEGLSYDDILSVTINGVDVPWKFVGTAPTVDAPGQEFKIAIAPETVKANGGKTVVVRFTATLNKDAHVGADGNPNSVKLTYSNSWTEEGDAGFEYETPGTTPTPTPGPDSPTPTIPDGKIPKEGKTETPEDSVITYTGTVELVKVDGADNKVVLEGAEFEIRKSDAEDAAALNFVLQENGTYKHVTTAETSATTKLVTGKDGKITIVGLDKGTYYAVETKAPAGYSLDSTPKAVTLTVDGNSFALETAGDIVTTQGNDTTYAQYKVTWHEIETETANNAIKIENNKGITLPGTGGIGTTLFTLGGLAMVILACVMFISYARKQKKQA